MNSISSIKEQIASLITKSFSWTKADNYERESASLDHITEHLGLRPNLRTGDQFIVQNIDRLVRHHSNITKAITVELLLVSGFKLEVKLEDLLKYTFRDVKGKEYTDDIERLILLRNEIFQVIKDDENSILVFASTYSSVKLEDPIETLEEFKDAVSRNVLRSSKASQEAIAG